MQATISKWGNSLAVRLPRHVVDRARLVEGTTVDLEVGDDGSLRLIPARRKFKLSELLEGHPPPERASDSHEVDWGQPKGEEAW